MEFSERCIQTLENEGFSSVSEQSCGADTLPQSFPAAAAALAMIVTDGSLTVAHGSTSRILKVGDRLDIPAHIPYSITSGASGYQLIFGEK